MVLPTTIILCLLVHSCLQAEGCRDSCHVIFTLKRDCLMVVLRFSLLPPHLAGSVVQVHSGMHGRAMIFTDTKKEANELVVCESLQQLKAQVMHGDIEQKQREITLKVSWLHCFDLDGDDHVWQMGWSDMLLRTFVTCTSYTVSQYSVQFLQTSLEDVFHCLCCKLRQCLKQFYGKCFSGLPGRFCEVSRCYKRCSKRFRHSWNRLGSPDKSAFCKFVLQRLCENSKKSMAFILGGA